MKRIRLVMTVALALSALMVVYGQTRKPIEVTAQTLATQPTDKPYLIDLTRKGNTYNVAADAVSRVQVITSKGKLAMSDLVKKLGLTGSKFLFGTLSDLSAVDFGFPPGGGTLSPDERTTAAKCDSLVCTCNGRQDCSDLSKTGWCGEAAACGIGKGGKPGRWGCTCTKR